MIRKLFLFIILILIIFISGCPVDKEYIPNAKLDLSLNQVYINNEIYSQPLTVSVIKKDSDRTPILFTIKFLSPNSELMKFTNLNNEEIMSINTIEQTMLDDDRISKEFKVWAKKFPGQGKVPYHTSIELWYKDRKLDRKELVVNIN